MSNQIATKPNLLGQPNTFFRKGDFEATLWKKGYPILLEKAVTCPCQTKDNQPLPDCQSCMGYGYVFVNPLETRGIISNLNQSNKLKSWSVELIGTASLTLLQSHRISYMDRITILNNSYIENKTARSEVLTLRGETGSEFIFLSYKPISVFAILIFNGSTKKLYQLDPTTDFAISTINPYVINFTFDFSTIADFNNVVSVLYLHEIQYLIIDIPNIIRNSMKVGNTGGDEQVLLPTHAVIRLSHNVLQIKDTNGNGLLSNDIDVNLWG